MSENSKILIYKNLIVLAYKLLVNI